MSISTGDLQALVDRTNTFFEDYGEDAWLELEEAVLHLKAEQLKLVTHYNPPLFRALGRAIEILDTVKREGKYEIPKRTRASNE